MNKLTPPAKYCKGCLVVKESAAFYLYAINADGLTTLCRECTCARVRAHRLRNVERIRAYDIRRGPAHRKTLRLNGTGQSTRETPQMLAAHNALTRAVRASKVIRPMSCERCHKSCKPHGHHEDYAKKLDVMWLCPVCHAARHKELGRL